MQKQIKDLLNEQDTCKPVSRRKIFEKTEVNTSIAEFKCKSPIKSNLARKNRNYFTCDFLPKFLSVSVQSYLVMDK